jgi:hypothetical protein
MFSAELEGVEESKLPATAMYFDSKSAIAMGESYWTPNTPDTSCAGITMFVMA